MSGDLRKPDVVTVLINRRDGGVTVLRVITAEYRPATPEEVADGSGPRVVNWTVKPTPEYITSIIAKHDWPPDLQPVTWELVPNDMVHEGTDRTFRAAWKANGKHIEVDMSKAREIQRDVLRRDRIPLLDALDVEYQRADERGDVEAKRAIAAQKQRLRDAPQDPRIAAAQTPEELRAITLAMAIGANA